jgi:mRNA interferase RelE/StbE
MYIPKFHKRVEKFLLSHLEIAKRFHPKMLLLLKGETASLDIKPLQGEENRYRLRVGDYRFLYEVRELEIVVYFYEAGPRGDVYK